MTISTDNTKHIKNTDHTELECKHAAGIFVPRIDPNRCEGKEDCLEVCPYDVFEMQVLTPEQRAALSLKGRIKGFFHGYRQAVAVRADACHACGLCVQACPERALTLMRVGRIINPPSDLAD